MGWLTVVLWLDAGRSHVAAAAASGRLTWVLLLVALSPGQRRRCGPRPPSWSRSRPLVEYIFSPTLEVYVYRFDNVPAFVPPGPRPGLPVRVRARPRRVRAAAPARVHVAGRWSSAAAGRGYGVAARRAARRARRLLVRLPGAVPVLRPVAAPVYVGAFVAVSWLELRRHRASAPGCGSTRDPTGWVSIGNPPSGAAGGYGWFDLAGLLAAPYAAALVSRGRLTRSAASGLRGPVDAR